MDNNAPARPETTYRIMTYNVHRCLGADGKSSPQRIAAVIAACDPDIVALQELDVGRVRTSSVDQAAAIARELGMQPHFHAALRLLGEEYGNAILTKTSSSLVKAGLLPGANSPARREPRGALWVATEFTGTRLDIVNTHLGLNRAERSAQVGALLGPDWLAGRPRDSALILVGDSNVGRRSRSCRRLASCIRPARDAKGGRRLLACSSRLPMLALDHVFASDAIEAVDVRAVRTKLTRVASDHLPLLAEFRLLRASAALREQAA